MPLDDGHFVTEITVVYSIVECVAINFGVSLQTNCQLVLEMQLLRIPRQYFCAFNKARLVTTK